MIQKMTPAQVAAFNYRLTGGKCDPDAVGLRFLNDAAVMDDYAERALSSKTGKYRGFTATQAREVADDLRARSVSVPAELRKLIG